MSKAIKSSRTAGPATDHGAILVTTRRHMVASQPIGQGLEITDFTIDDGAKIVLHFLQTRKEISEEEAATKELLELLQGFALAVSQLTAYMST